MGHASRVVFIVVTLSMLTVGAITEAQLFYPGVEYNVGDGPVCVGIADLDEDGIQDLLVTNGQSFERSVLIGIGNGTFAPAVNTVTNGSGRFAIDDLDGDGHLDVVAASYDSGIYVLLGNGDGSFQAETFYEISGWTVGVAIGDLDKDGVPDLAVVSQIVGYVSVLLGQGDGTFSAAVHYQAADETFDVAIADCNQDGHSDLAVTNRFSHNVSIYQGNGDGTFQDGNSYDGGNQPAAVLADDLNGDGFQDLVLANSGTDEVSFLPGSGDGTYEERWTNEAGWKPFFLAMADFDGDGNLDLASANEESDSVSVLLGLGDGTFQNTLNFEVGDRPYSIAAGDLNGDGVPDLVVTNLADDTISVMINRTFVSFLATGPGPGPDNDPLVRVWPPVQNGERLFEFAAYGAQGYGVNVSSGDPDGDGSDQILTGAGPGDIYGPHVRGFEVDGTPLPGLNFLAYGTNKFGVNVVAGDLDGDGQDEIITGAGPGAVFGPHVRGWRYNGAAGVTPLPGVSYFAYGTPKWGVNVAAGDIDGDGYDEIITGAGPGAVYGPHVRGWNVDGGGAAAIPGVSFLAYGTNKYGVNVSVGDVDGDGIDEIVTGAGPGAIFGPHVRGWNYDGSAVTPLPGLSFFAWDTEPLRFGATVFAAADLNLDGRDELVVGRGPAPEADTEIKVFTWDGSTVSLMLSLEAYPGLTHGTTVAAGRL